MDEAEKALFDKNVRSTIRKCAVVTAPVWLPIMGALGWWLTNLDGKVEVLDEKVDQQSGILTKVETKLEFVVDAIKDNK